MKYLFTVEYDSDIDQFTIMDYSDNVDVEHSGSSYLRIKPKDKSFYGTIDCGHNDLLCYEGGLKIGAPLKCKGQHLKFFIEKVKTDEQR